MIRKNKIKKVLSILLMLSLFIGGVCQHEITLKAETTNENDSQEITDNEEIEDDLDEENFDDCVLSDLSDDELLEVTYEVTSKWESHYNVDVTLRNVSGEMIDNWEVYFDFKDKIENIWNARISKSEEGDSVVIHNADWNQDILEDESVTFGMTVRYEGEIEFPEECYLTREQTEVDEENYVVEYIQNNKWENHVNGQIKITNVGTDRIEDWKLDFETTIVLQEIESIWNAKLIEIDEGTYCQVDNATYNQNIEPGQSVEFGFIARCDGGIGIEETTLYHMVNAEYEEDEMEDDTVDRDNPYWEPRYNLDDFDTYEEYVEYCNRIGYQPISLFAGTKLNSVVPSVNTEIVSKVETGAKGKATQSYLWDGEDLLTLFRKPKPVPEGTTPTDKQKKANNAAWFSKATRTKAGYYLSDQTTAIVMRGFSHGQSFERCNVNGKKKFIMGAGATNGTTGWSKNVAFINDSTLLNANEEIQYAGNKKIKKITGFKYLIDKSLSKNPKVSRLDAALSADGKFLVVWMQVKNCNQRVIALLKMSELKKVFYGDNPKEYYSLKSKKKREKALIAVASAPASKLQPNNSFQSIEVSNKYKNSKKWKIYITSGNTGKGQPLRLVRAVLSKGSEKNPATISDFCSVNVNVPYNKQGVEILSGELELEGCHIKGKELQFIMTKSNPEEDDNNKNEDNDYSSKNGDNKKVKELKVVQYIVGINKSFQ